MNWVIRKTDPGKRGKRSSIRKVERRKPKGIFGVQTGINQPWGGFSLQRHLEGNSLIWGKKVDID